MTTRSLILNSHRELTKFMNTDIINKLVHLFDDDISNYANENYKITKFIEDERRFRGLDNSNITVSSELYGENNDNSTLFLIIKKNNIDILHLSIHLTIKNLNSNSSGIIHISKNICKKIKLSKKKKSKPYALILVKQPFNKPNSLEFSIANGYDTSNVSNAILHDRMLQQEMDVIITVLNRLFDENNKDFYVGNSNKLIQIHNKTNFVLKNINSHKKHATRKNMGKRVMPLLNNNEKSIINYKLNSKNKRNTLKVNN